MQKLPHKLLIFFTFLSLMLVQVAHSQDVSKGINLADELFEKREYSKALEKYQSLLDSGQYSPQMLMKMAFIQEGFGKIPQALYYLSLLNKLAPTEATLQKMEEIASNHSLEGYGISDEAYFMYLLRKYKSEVLLGMGFLGMVGLLLLLLLQRRKYDILFPSILLGAYCLLIALVANIQKDVEKAIVFGNDTFVMDAPSAGASLLSTIKAGHRVVVVDKVDIWYEVEWQGEKAFIRNNNLQIIR